MPWLGIENLEALPGVRGCSPLRGEKKRGMQREVLIFALGKKGCSSSAPYTDNV